jgi:hypothetical protein
LKRVVSNIRMRAFYITKDVVNKGHGCPIALWDIISEMVSSQRQFLGWLVVVLLICSSGGWRPGAPRQIDARAALGARYGSRDVFSFSGHNRTRFLVYIYIPSEYYGSLPYSLLSVESQVALFDPCHITDGRTKRANLSSRHRLVQSTRSYDVVFVYLTKVLSRSLAYNAASRPYAISGQTSEI